MKQVLLLLAQGFEEYEAAVFTDVLGWSRAYGTEPVGVTTAGLRQSIRCTWNLTVTPQRRIEDISLRDFDALAIPGGFEEKGFYEDAYDERFLDTIRAFNREKKLIASVCVAALPLARSGVLRGRKATTYHRNQGVRREQLAGMGAVVLDQHMVEDGNIITSSCPATALDVAFRLLLRLTSEENLERVKEYMGF